MKKLLFLSSSFSFIYPLISFAQYYPDTCPTEAQSVLQAVGGCSGIDPQTYANIYSKCCVQVTSNQNLIIYVILGVLVVALIIWQILERRKNKILVS